MADTNNHSASGCDRIWLLIVMCDRMRLAKRVVRAPYIILLIIIQQMAVTCIYKIINVNVLQ